MYRKFIFAHPVSLQGVQVKVIGSRSGSQEQKGRHCIFPQRKTAFDNDPI